jgi:hypothetical protein
VGNLANLIMRYNLSAAINSGMTVFTWEDGEFTYASTPEATGPGPALPTTFQFTDVDNTETVHILQMAADGFHIEVPGTALNVLSPHTFNITFPVRGTN